MLRRVGLGALVLGIILVGAAMLRKPAAGPQDSRVDLQSVSEAGAGPFTPSVVDDSVPSALPKTPSPPSAEGGRIDASVPELYAAPRDRSSCKAGELVSLLQAGSERAGAWAAAAGIGLSDIKDFVATLTPALLRLDTRVTSFVFREGSSIPGQAVLQSGTAVMIDRKGLPAVRCKSGAPLGPPETVDGSPKYAGDAWSGFDDDSVVQVSALESPTGWMTFFNIGNVGSFGRLTMTSVIVDFNPPESGKEPSVVQVGQRVKISGGTWPAGVTLQVHFDDPPVPIANPVVDATGVFTTEIVVPKDAPPGAHTLTITGEGSTVNQPLYVIPRNVRVTRK